MLVSSCLLTIQSRMAEFSKKEQSIAGFILNHPSECISPTIDELADLCEVSEATLFRFVRKLGYEGYQQFRIALAMETEAFKTSSANNAGTVTDNDSWMSEVFRRNINTLENTMRSLDTGDLDAAVALLYGATRIHIFGLGGSGVVAQDAYSKFIRIGLPCLAPIDYHFQLMSVSHFTEDDVALLVVHNGVNPDATLLAQKIRTSPARMIFLTNYRKSPIVELADVSLFSTPASSAYTFDRQSVRIALYTLVDCLYQGVVDRMGEGADQGLRRMRNGMMKIDPPVSPRRPVAGNRTASRKTPRR